jgi:hypothetical protein
MPDINPFNRKGIIMQVKHIALAIAAAAAGQAFAATTAPVNVANIPAANFIYYTGASAPTNIVYNALNMLCDTGTMTVYTKADISANVVPGDSAIGGSLGYTCKIKAGAGTTVDGQNIAFLFQNSGGSINSVYGMNSATKKKFISLTSGCVSSGQVTNDANGYAIMEKCSETVSRTSHGGFSDVERQLWRDAFLAVPVTDFVVDDVQVTPVPAGQPFGIAVSRPLYKAMQQAQGIYGVGGCDENNQTEACQPSITKRQYAAIINNDPFSVTKTDWSWLVGSAGLGMNVNVCRRPPTSGTQASSNAFFMNTPCGAFADRNGELGAARFTDSAAPTFVVHEMSGTGDVKECLSGADLSNPADGIIGKGENFDLGLSPNANTTPADWSIGVVSAENNPKTASATETWRFVKLDGVAVYDGAGNTASTKAGNYDFAFELVLHTHPTITSSVAGSVFQAIATNMADSSLPSITGLYRMADSIGNRGNNACSPFRF